jgi:hypothetical protein
MKTVKKTLLIGATILALLSLSGCMMISCDDCRPPKPRRHGRPSHCRIVTVPPVHFH